MDRIYFFYRIERFFYLRKIPIIPVLIRVFIRLIFSCDIPYKANIGKKTSFPHDGLGIVIHPNTVIGENCRILHGVTIGGRSGHTKVPVIGNNVILGVGSTIIGPIHVGNNSIIGAGSVVTKDVPDNSIVAGVPATVINKIKL